MKRHVLLLTAALGMAAAQPSAPAPAPASAPQSAAVLRDPQLSSAPVTVNTGTYRGPLSVLLLAVAKGAGYDVVFNFNVDALALIEGRLSTTSSTTTTSSADGSTTQTSSATGTASYASPTGRPQELSAKPIAYSFVNKPFNEVWPLLMDIYELQYSVVRVGNSQVLRIGQRPAQLAVPLTNIDAPYAYQRALEFFGERIYTELPIRDATGTIVDKVRQFDGYALTGTLKIVPDTANNRLIVGGTAEETAKVRSFVSTIDIPKAAVAAIPQSQVIYTAKGSPADVTSLLKSRFPNLSLAQYGSSPQVVISGVKGDVDAALALLTQVDRPAPAPAPTEVPTAQRIYAVKGQQADLVALLGTQFPELKVTAVGQTRQIVITGPQNRLDAALNLLEQIDRPVAATASASPTVQRVYAVQGQQADIVALLGAQFPELRVTPVGQTGQLIITGVQSQLDPALALLGQVDRPAQTGPQIVQRVFTLINASAEEVKATLEGTLAREVTPEKPAITNVPVNATDANGNSITVTVPASNAKAEQTQTAQAAEAPAANTNAATLIADRRTNTLIVRGTASQVAQVAELIPQLDQVVPQINVQVRIQEITEEASRALGMDWKVNFGGFSISVGGGGLGATFDPTRSLVAFNIFPTLQALENQGLTKRVYDGSITMQSGQRALGQKTDTQNASDTASATIKSGGQFDLNIPSVSGNIQKTIDYGVLIDFFSPQVAPDGTITLRVRGKVSDLIAPKPIPTDGTPIPVFQFSNSEAQTTITFKSGQTVLLGGLLSNTETSTKVGVPFLSSIPVIGGAFGKQTTERRQSQLMVVITGTVVK